MRLFLCGRGLAYRKVPPLYIKRELYSRTLCIIISSWTMNYFQWCWMGYLKIIFYQWFPWLFGLSQFDVLQISNTWWWLWDGFCLTVSDWTECGVFDFSSVEKGCLYFTLLLALACCYMEINFGPWIIWSKGGMAHLFGPGKTYWLKNIWTQHTQVLWYQYFSPV